MVLAALLYGSPPRPLAGPGCPVTDARDGLYDLGPRRVALDLGPEPADVDVYVAARQIVRARGDGLGNLGAREGLPRSPHEQSEDLELRRRQVERRPLPAHGVAVGVELERTEPDDPVPVLALLPPEPAQNGLDPGLELLGVERLGYVVVGPELQPHYLVHRLALGREQDYGDVALLAHLLQYLEPAHPRQHDVENDQVKGLPTKYHERLDPVLGRQHPITFGGQHDGSYLQQRRVVVHQQNRLLQAPRNLPADYNRLR